MLTVNSDHDICRCIVMFDLLIVIFDCYVNLDVGDGLLVMLVMDHPVMGAVEVVALDLVKARLLDPFRAVSFVPVLRALCLFYEPNSSYSFNLQHSKFVIISTHRYDLSKVQSE